MRTKLGLICRLSALAAALGATGCSTQQPIDLNSASANSGLLPVKVITSNYTIQTLQPRQLVSDTLRVYIEGDGRAWISSRTVSDDPTPITSSMPRLAIEDPAGAVYLARPCQYVMSPSCKKADWTHNRFGPAALRSMSETLDQLKSKYRNRDFELIGYSGGGTMALLLAATREDVSQVQTIVGNLDPAAWTSIKKLSPLTGSLNPTDYAVRLKTIPQRHIVGMQDKVVPQEVAQAYMMKVEPVCGELVYVNADHHSGWQESWEHYRANALSCQE